MLESNFTFISSEQNSKIKLLKAVQDKKRKRKETRLFCIEGEKEILHALHGGYSIKNLFCKEGIPLASWIKKLSLEEGFEVEENLFERLCYRKSSSAFLALVEEQDHRLADLKKPKAEATYLIAEAPEKPGNIGAMLRSCDALGVDAFILVNPKTELYNPNVIRSSVGCLFSVPIAITNTEELKAFCTSHQIAVFSTAFNKEALNYSQEKYKGKIAIAVGTEDTGLSPKWLTHFSKSIIIPMQGQNDSLNVSVAAAILLSEVQRQKKLGS